jgi:hypothetical protein
VCTVKYLLSKERVQFIITHFSVIFKDLLKFLVFQILNELFGSLNINKAVIALASFFLCGTGG